MAERGIDVPVLFDGVLVHAGDLVLADGSGVVFLPADRATEIIDTAERLAARQDAMGPRSGRRAGDRGYADDRFRAALSGEE